MKKLNTDKFIAKSHIIHNSKADIIHPIIKKSMGDLYQKTIERKNLIKSMGYNLIVIWENTFKHKEIEC